MRIFPIRSALYFVLLSFSIFARTVPKERIRFVHYFPGNNQSENSITCFLQDRQGFMWIGSKDGLYRFDGYQFQSFRTEHGDPNSLSGSYIRCILEYSGDEVLLIGTDSGGLNIYNKRTGEFTRFMHDEHDSTSIGSNAIFDMLEDQNGDIWLATVGGGLNRFDIKKGMFKRYFIGAQNPDSVKMNFLKNLYLDREGGLWVGTRFLGLYLFDRGTERFRFVFKETQDPENRPVNDIWSITQDQTGDLWVGTEGNGLYRLKKAGINWRLKKKYYKSNGLTRRSILKVVCDSKGTIWVGAWAGGLYHYHRDTDQFTQYDNNPEDPFTLTSNHVLSIYENRAGSLWIGTHAGGINVLHPSQWKFDAYQFQSIRKNTIHFNEVRSIFYQAETRTAWLGSIQGLIRLNMTNGDTLNFKNDPGDGHSLSNNAVNTIYPDADPGVLWIGTPNGLNRMDTRTGRFTRYMPETVQDFSLSDFNILDIHRDDGDTLWISSANGRLNRLDPGQKQFRSFTILEKDSTTGFGGSVNTVLACESELYIGTSRGLFLFEKTSGRICSISEKYPECELSRYAITTFYQDIRGILWIGTGDHGLFRFEVNSGQIRNYLEQDGLCSNQICAITEDSGGILFVSTDDGICRFDPYSEIFTHYSLQDGLHDLEFKTNSCWKGEDGRICFGGVNGFTSVMPEKMVVNTHVPPVHIIGFSLLYDSTRHFDSMLYRTSLELNHRDNSFAVDFTALNFVNPGKNTYLYKLEGYDRDWNDSGSQHSATYKNVDPGKYTFIVRGSNDDGVWNETGDFLAIDIRPPIWRTAWFQAFILCMAAGAVFYLIKRRFAVLHRETEMRRRFTHALITSQESERKRIAAELHDSLGQDLLVIRNRTSLFLKREKQHGMNRGQLEQICSIADEAISNIRQISHNLHPYQLEKIGLTDALKSMINKISDASSIQFEHEIDNISDLLPKDQEINCYRVVQELTNNIVKHSKAVKAWIKIVRKEAAISIDVKDNGIGFNVSEVIKAKKGYGLSGISERIEILKGRMKIKADLNTGAHFYIEIPI